MRHVKGAGQELFLDPDDFNASLGQLLAQYAPDSVFGAPSVMLRLRGHMSTDIAAGVRFVKLIGEYMTAAADRALKEAFPQAQFKYAYMATDTMTVATSRCQYLPLNHYHLAPRVSVRIHTPDTEGVGGVLISKVMNPGTPLEWHMQEYDIGDAGRLLSEPCACGEEVTLHVFGRSGFDYIKLLGAVFRQEECDRVATVQQGAYEDYRLEASEVEVQGALRGRVHVRFSGAHTLSSADMVHLVQEFSELLYVTPTRSLADMVREGVFLPPTASFADAFPQNAKTVRLKYIPL
jgi:phenylacetate-coenzyme A ligase PaaK-like adenylate-forming protein